MSVTIKKTGHGLERGQRSVLEGFGGRKGNWEMMQSCFNLRNIKIKVKKILFLIQIFKKKNLHLNINILMLPVMINPFSYIPDTCVYKY